MKQVTIERERRKPSELLDFISWKDDRRSFYARPRNCKPRVVTLIPALPAGAEWTKEPFQECAPVTIKPCYLLPPPCRQSPDEWQNVVADKWEFIYGETHRNYLHLTKNDDTPLLVRLDGYKKAARGFYEQEKKSAEQIADPAERAHEIKMIEDEYNTPLHTVHGIECAGTLNMTLNMVKRGCGELPGDLPGRTCIRDAYLVGLWAKREGIDLAEMDRWRAECREWIDEHAWRPAKIADSWMKDRRRGFVPMDFRGDRDPRFLEFCAGVRFRVEFEDGKAAYLTDCPPSREELRTEEWKELKREHGFETPHERRVRMGKKKGGEKSRKVKDSLTVKAIGDKVRQGMAAKKGPTTAGKYAARWAQDRFQVKISYKTAQNYAKRTGGMETGNR